MNKYLITAFLILGLVENGFGQAPDWQWAKSFSGSASSECRKIILDPFGNIYSTGRFSGTVDFDPGNGVYNLTSGGAFDIFISKLDPAGNLIWAKQISGPNDDIGNSLDIDETGNLYVTGFFGGPSPTDFDPDSLNTYYLTAGGVCDVFVLKLNNNGQFVWALSFGGNSQDVAFSITLDSINNGEIFLAGTFKGFVDFDPGAGSFYLTSTGPVAGFIYKLDYAGTFIWAKALQTTSTQFNVGSLKLASNGDVLLSGSFKETVDFDPDTLSSFLLNSDSTNSDIFVARYNNTGNLLWAIRVGSTYSDYASSIAIDLEDNSYVTGSFVGHVDFDPDSISSYYPVSNQLKSVPFILKLNIDGKFVFAKSIVGTNSNLGTDITLGVLPSGNLFFTGQFKGVADFDPDSSEVFNLVSDTLGPRFFISKFDTAGNFLWAKKTEGFASSFCPPYSIAADNYGNAFVAGYFIDTLIFKNDTLYNTQGVNDAYIAKIGTCSSNFFLYPDSLQNHHYYAVNNAFGAPPLQYDWSWGDGAHDYTAYPNHVYADSGYYDICLTITDSVGCSSTYCDLSFYLARGTSSGSMVYVNVVDQIVTSIAETTSNNVLTLAPNPATNKLKISSSADAIHSIEIFSLTGEKIFSDPSHSPKFSAEMSVENWNPGIYFVKIQTEKVNVVKKFIKE